jgi:glucose-1-phosphate thymidylyltransferase
MKVEKAINEGEVLGDSSIQGRVQIGKRTKISDGTLIRGPVAIGENCQIERAFIGPFTSIGNNVKIIGAELEHSIIFDDANIDCHRRIVDAIIGRNASVTSSDVTMPRGNKLIIGDNALVEL